MSAYVLGQFAHADAWLKAARRLTEAKLGEVDLHSPYPVHGVEDALGLKRSPVPFFAGLAALLGVLSGYALQYYANVYDYPLNVGGRPQHSPPTFIPITFEVGILFTALTLFGVLLWRMRLPRPHHPVFEVDAFRRALTHELWLSVATEPTRLDEAKRLLSEAGADQVSVVEVTP